MMQLLVFPLLFLGAAVNASSQLVHYVKPDHHSSSCPGQPCITLNQYISQAATYFTTNATFLFLAGNHSVNSTLYLKDVSKIHFKGCTNCSVTIALYEALPVIQCENVSTFAVEGLKFVNFLDGVSKNISLLTFYASKKIKLYNLTFQGRSNFTMIWVGAVSISHSHVVIRNSHFKENTGGALSVSNRSSVTIENCLFRENNAVGNYGGALNVSDGCSVTIASSIFERNRAGVGGAVIVMKSNITIIWCLFQENAAYGDVGARLFAGALYAESSKSVIITNCNFTGNTVGKAQSLPWSGGGAIHLFKSNILITSCTNGIGDATVFHNNSAQHGGAVYVESSKVTLTTRYFCFNNSGNVSKAMYNGHLHQIAFSDNHASLLGGAIYLSGSSIEYKTDTSGTNFLLTRNTGSAIAAFQSNASFNGDVYIGTNTGETGGGISASSSSISFIGAAVFEENHASKDGGAFWMQQSALSFFGYAILHNNTTTGNGGAGFTTDTGTVIIWDNITLSYSCATKGGALFFQNGAIMKLMKGATLNALHNHVSEYGGTIYYSDSILPTQCEFAMSDERLQKVKSVEKLPLCFLQVEHWGNTFVHEINNTASLAGNFLYGGLVDKCKVHNRIHGGWILLYDILDIKRNEAIASQVYELCFCQAMKYNCSTTKSITTHRGRRFDVSLLALVQGDMSSSATVRAKLRPTARLHPNQLLQDIPDNCTALSYNLFSANETEQLILYPDGGPCNDIGMARATINVTFLPCPDAFTLSGDQCVCEERLHSYNVECRITDDNNFIEIKAGSRIWMNALYSNGSYQGLVLYPTCPMGYCRNSTVAVSLWDPDLQCDQNRSGVLCGACATNHSLMLGSSGCKICSNAYLLLILSFAAAGIVLVVFITLLRLTVASGRINSIILYANIVQANKDILFFSSSNNSVNTVFIAWMNLDLGFHTCFYDGMDAYAQTWLQLAFPVYVWILMSLIILASRYSMTVTKLIGSNPIAVLATLLLMSYTKLLKIIIEVYSSVDLEYPGNKQVTVWLKDANEPYLQSRHLALTVVTTLLLVFLFLPYTLLLLLGYKLYRFTGRKHTRWLMRIKPLLDSYYAPYKMRTRYWTGFLLLVRCALYIVFSYNSLGDKKFSLLALIIAFAVIIFWPWLTIKIYPKSLTNAIEAVVYLNLIALSAAVSGLTEVDSPVVVDSLVGMVFVIMIGIIIYHFHIYYIAKSALWLKLRAKMTALRANLTEATPLLAPVANDAPLQRLPAVSATPSEREPTRSVFDIRDLLKAADD